MYVRGMDVNPAGANCAACTLRTEPIVLGYGPQPAEVMVIAEAPGYNEVQKGRPLIGRSGQLLDRALAEIGVTRDGIRIENVVTCRPPDNRDPTKEEVAACSGRLKLAIAETQPKFIIPLGAFAYKAIMPGKRSIKADNGKLFTLEDGTKVVPVLHPAAVLRSPRLYGDFVGALRFAFEVLAGKVEQTPSTGLDYRVITEPSQVASIYRDKAMENARFVSVDVETASDGRMLCVGISFDPFKTVHVVTASAIDALSRHTLSQIFTHKRIQTVGHNLKYDVRVLWNNGIDCRFDHDTMLMHYSMDERKGTHGLDELAKNFLRVEPWYDKIAPYYKRMEDADSDEMYRYNAYDVLYTGQLFLRFMEDMSATNKSIYDEYLIPGGRELLYAEHRGVRINQQAIGELGGVLEKDIEAKLSELYKLAGEEFNPNSPKQLLELLFNKLGLPIPDGNLSTDENTLKLLTSFHPIAQALLDYRQLHKLYGTYVTGIQKKLDSEGAIHCNFNVHGTETGRLSSSNPNLQNIPVRSERGKTIRKLFVARPGATLVELDVSQAELRTLAWFSQDPKLIEIFQSGHDLHTATAALMYHVKLGDVTSDQRRKGKTVNFAVVYGAGPDKVMETIGCSYQEAKEAIELWFKQFSRAAEWMESKRQEALTTGQVTMPHGRKRSFPIITRENRGDVLRQAVNTPVQGYASDITFKSFARVGQTFREYLEDLMAYLLLTVHDSMLSETFNDPIEVARLKYRTVIKVAEEMCPGVPFEADAKIGKSWGEMEEVDHSILRASMV